MQTDLSQITTLADQVASTRGLIVLDVKLGQQGKNRTLAVTIYKQGSSIGLDDCEQVSRQLERLLDEQTPPLLEGSYLLEVQSPGIDRKLSSEREFALFQGQKVQVKTKQKVDGLGSAFTGMLSGFHEGRLHIGCPQKITDGPNRRRPKTKQSVQPNDHIEVELSNVIQVCLVPQPLAASSQAKNGIKS